MDILGLISSFMSNSNSIEKLSSKTGTKASQVQQLVQLGFPMLMAAINKNASSSEGARSLDKALEQHQEDHVEDPDDFLDHVDEEDSEKMIGHILHDKKDSIEEKLAQKTGMKAQQVADLLKRFAPLIIGALANQKKTSGLNSESIHKLTSSLSRTMASSDQSGSAMSLITQLLDTDKDGDIMDDLGKLMGKFTKK